MAERLFGIEVFVGHVEGFGPLVSVVVAGGNLERPTVGHDGVDADGVPSTGEGVPHGSLGFDDGQAEISHDAVNDVQILGDLPTGILFVNVGRMRFKEVNLTDANEGTGLLGFVAEGVDHLVNFQREVLVGTNPQREHRVHRRLGGWTQEHRNVEVVLPACFTQ